MGLQTSKLESLRNNAQTSHIKETLSVLSHLSIRSTFTEYPDGAF